MDAIRFRNPHAFESKLTKAEKRVEILRETRVNKRAYDHEVIMDGANDDNNNNGEGQQNNGVLEGNNNIMTGDSSSPFSLQNSTTNQASFIMSSNRRKGCNCKKSKCLKKYCDCFYSRVYCSKEWCNCRDCLNFEGSEQLKEVIQRKKMEDLRELKRMDKRNLMHK